MKNEFFYFYCFCFCHPTLSKKLTQLPPSGPPYPDAAAASSFGMHRTECDIIVQRNASKIPHRAFNARSFPQPITRSQFHHDLQRLRLISYNKQEKDHFAHKKVEICHPLAPSHGENTRHAYPPNLNCSTPSFRQKTTQFTPDANMTAAIQV